MAKPENEKKDKEREKERRRRRRRETHTCSHSVHKNYGLFFLRRIAIVITSYEFVPNESRASSSTYQPFIVSKWEKIVCRHFDLDNDERASEIYDIANTNTQTHNFTTHTQTHRHTHIIAWEIVKNYAGFLRFELCIRGIGMRSKRYLRKKIIF